MGPLEPNGAFRAVLNIAVLENVPVAMLYNRQLMTVCEQLARKQPQDSCWGKLHSEGHVTAKKNVTRDPGYSDTFTTPAKQAPKGKGKGGKPTNKGKDDQKNKGGKKGKGKKQDNMGTSRTRGRTSGTVTRGQPIRPMNGSTTGPIGRLRTTGRPITLRTNSKETGSTKKRKRSKEPAAKWPTQIH